MKDPKDEEPVEEEESDEPIEAVEPPPAPPAPPTRRKPREPQPIVEPKPRPRPKPVPKPAPKTPAPKAPAKPKPAPKRRPAATKSRPPTGWFRRTISWLGLILIGFSASMLLYDVKITGLHIELPTFWKKQLQPGELVILIDAGHGGYDSGARGNSVVEKDLNLDVAKRVKEELDGRGIHAELTRTSDKFLPLSERTSLANRLENCVFVSIHFNDAKDKSATGLETYYSTEKAQLTEGTWVREMIGFIYQEEKREDDSRLLAEAIQGALVEATGAADRGVKDRRLFVVRRTHHPSVLVEGGFVSNAEEAKKLADPDYREKLAHAIAEGLVDYLASTQRLRTASTE